MTEKEWNDRVHTHMVPMASYLGLQLFKHIDTKSRLMWWPRGRALPHIAEEINQWREERGYEALHPDDIWGWRAWKKKMED